MDLIIPKEECVEPTVFSYFYAHPPCQPVYNHCLLDSSTTTNISIPSSYPPTPINPQSSLNHSFITYSSKTRRNIKVRLVLLTINLPQNIPQVINIHSNQSSARLTTFVDAYY